MTKTLEALAIDKKIDCYNFRSRGKFAVDLLLDDSVVASKAHDTLTEAVDDSVVVALPEMICPKRVYFVGLPGKISADKLLDLLSNRFPELLLKKSNKYCIKIFEPKCCKNDKNQIRSTVYLSEELYNFFMINLSGRVPVGFLPSAKKPKGFCNDHRVCLCPSVNTSHFSHYRLQFNSDPYQTWHDDWLWVQG